MIELTSTGAGYARRRRRVEPLKLLISLFQIVLGLTGVTTLILFFYTGSFSAAGALADSSMAYLLSLLPW